MGSVSVTGTVPIPGGEVTRIVTPVEFWVTETFVPGAEPNNTFGTAELNPVPLMVIGVPPVAGPEVGVYPVMVGVYVKYKTGFSNAFTPLTRTYIGTVPLPGGMVAVIDVPSGLTIDGVTFVVPNSTIGFDPNS